MSKKKSIKTKTGKVLFLALGSWTLVLNPFFLFSLLRNISLYLDITLTQPYGKYFLYLNLQTIFIYSIFAIIIKSEMLVIGLSYLKV
jgi:hypothetical protein